MHMGSSSLVAIRPDFRLTLASWFLCLSEVGRVLSPTAPTRENTQTVDLSQVIVWCLTSEWVG